MGASLFTCLIILLEIPAPANTAGGIIAADVNNDGRMDLLVTVPGHLAAYDTDGKKLWIVQADIRVSAKSETNGLPGHHGPGVAAGDVDGDGKCEVVFLTNDSVLHVLDGATGQEKASASPPLPKGASRWEVAMLADFRGTGGDNDVLLQATHDANYRMGGHLAAYSMERLLAGGNPLWTIDQFVSCAHSSARLADINDDGKDEVIGATIFSADGKLLAKAANFPGHMDSVFVADVLPDKPGLEVVLLEEAWIKKDRHRRNHVQVIGADGAIWRHHFKWQEPQNAAIGRFAKDSNEIFIWCRSRYPKHQKPFVFDRKGNVAYQYEMDDVAPEGWTASGVEVIHTIDWTGRRQQLACAKERHEYGDVCVFEPLTGKFVLRIPEKANRLYVADVTGDWREEIIVLRGNELRIYSNTAPNPRPNEKRLWSDRNYRRRKQCHNYYSP